MSLTMCRMVRCPRTRNSSRTPEMRMKNQVINSKLPRFRACPRTPFTWVTPFPVRPAAAVGLSEQRLQHEVGGRDEQHHEQHHLGPDHLLLLAGAGAPKVDEDHPQPV